MYLGLNKEKKPICLDSADFLTHGVILGRTGSGKTGLTIALLEEVAACGSSAIVLDPKGDLTNLALSLSSKAEFARWAEGDSEAIRLQHGEGLATFGLGFDHVEWWRKSIDVKIYAPGKSQGGGRVINIFPTFDIPRGFESAWRAKAARDVTAVLRAVDGTDDQFDPALVFLTEAVLSAWRNKCALPVEDWPEVLTSSSDGQTFGGMKLEDFFPKRQRIKLARTMIGFRHQADRWLSGEKLDFHHLAELAEKPQIAVFSMRHLSEEDRQFFSGLLFHKLVEYMFETTASKSLKLLVVLDEARGYLPPHPYNPPTKGPIGTILSQGRAQGIGMVIGTQNPMDLDYKALSNVGTWFVGRLRERDCARDLVSELSGRGVEIDAVTELPQRKFLLLDKRGKHHLLTVRWCYNHLRGPLSGQDLLRLEQFNLGPTIRLLPSGRRHRS